MSALRNGRGRCILSAACGDIDIRLVKHLGTFMLVCDGKVYALEKHASAPVHLSAKVDGIKFAAVYQYNKTANIIADDIEIARRENRQ